jgi:hypothetical protein
MSDRPGADWALLETSRGGVRPTPDGRPWCAPPRLSRAAAVPGPGATVPGAAGTAATATGWRATLARCLAPRCAAFLVVGVKPIPAGGASRNSRTPATVCALRPLASASQDGAAAAEFMRFMFPLAATCGWDLTGTGARATGSPARRRSSGSPDSGRMPRAATTKPSSHTSNNATTAVDTTPRIRARRPDGSASTGCSAVATTGPVSSSGPSSMFAGIPSFKSAKPPHRQTTVF